MLCINTFGRVRYFPDQAKKNIQNGRTSTLNVLSLRTLILFINQLYTVNKARPVKINGSPMSLTEKRCRFAKLNSKINHGFLKKKPKCPTFFCKKSFFVNNFTKVAESLQMKINIDIVMTRIIVQSIVN